MADRLAERHITGCATEELKVGKFSNTDAGQMNLYLNYAREHTGSTPKKIRLLG
jgi:hypothetical protein